MDGSNSSRFHGLCGRTVFPDCDDSEGFVPLRGPRLEGLSPHLFGTLESILLGWLCEIGIGFVPDLGSVYPRIVS
jgi:hypothetical protein